MFVKSSMDREVRYNKSTGSIILKPNTVTYVDDNLVTAKELIDCYGSRISVMSRETIEEYIIDNAPKAEEVIEEVEEVEDETPEEGVVTGGAADITENAGEAENEDLTSNTGDKEVDDFLNGETTVVPEGTEEITEEEALRLQKEAEAKAKAEEEAKAKEASKASRARAPKNANKKGAKKK